MDEVNINKYLSQFNPILIVPVLSAVVGAILVFVFGFKRPNEPRFQSNSSIDSLKKSKRKSNTAKSSEAQTSKQQIVSSSAKVGAGKKTTDISNAVTSKAISSNNNISKKKTDEKRTENGSPTKKVANKKIAKESATAINKKLKANKNTAAEGRDTNEKPADFDDGGWFTVQSKSKQKNKVDDLSGSQAGNSSPKVQAATKNHKPLKGAKLEAKQLASPPTSNESNNVSNNFDQSTVEPNEKTNNEQKTNENAVDTTISIVADDPVVVEASDIAVELIEQKPSITVPLKAAEVNPVADNAIAFDELGEWTDAKPDRKKGNKKKSRKD